MKTVLRHLRRVALLQAGDGASDGALLESFVSRREEAAFEVLLRRHGAMVLGVCRRVLGDAHDAEDAFQATFLVLARKAASVRPREMVGHWLYGVAYRTALKARTMNAKRRAKERRAGELPRREPRAEGAPDELLARLDAELHRLPDKYRVPVVLCELEGKSRRRVARLLGLPEGTLSWRLAHAKKLLARRLSRYGAALSVSSLAAVLSRDAAAACVPASLLHSTARAAILTAGVVSARVVALTDGVIKAMLLSKLKLVWAVALAVVVGVGAVGVTYRQAAAQPAPSNAPSRSARARADELEELRLEVAALRKGLEATRERVRGLEEEVQALRAAPRPGRVDQNAQVGPARHRPPGEGRNSNGGLTGSLIGNERNFDVNPLAEAEAALKKLRTNPSDKQAADALERALKRLKAREDLHRTYPQESSQNQGRQ
jgi:RNA polymerase sigma factor (sigma-70 family)